jgi:hypothetical protein
MIIEYLKCLTENPKMRDLGNNHDPDWDVNKPMGLKEIQELEVKYNQGNEFPKVLREFLYLAGSHNWIFDYIKDSYDELQQDVIEHFSDYSVVVGRPFFALEYEAAYSGVLLVHLDDGDDPSVWMYNPYNNQIPGQNGNKKMIYREVSDIITLKQTIDILVKNRIRK